VKIVLYRLVAGLVFDECMYVCMYVYMYINSLPLVLHLVFYGFILMDPHLWRAKRTRQE
jgi:hypothetical protein